jgi:hypothetical protein
VAGPERIEWRRAFPSRALVSLVWYVVLAGVVFDLAVRLRDFVGQANAHMATLAGFAPAHVLVACDEDR